MSPTTSSIPSPICPACSASDQETRTLDAVGPIIDGHRWIKERIGHLEAALERDDLDEGQRQAITTELDQLRAEHSRTGRRRWWRLFGGPRL